MRDSPHRRAALRAIAAVGNQVPFERTNSIGVARFLAMNPGIQSGNR